MALTFTPGYFAASPVRYVHVGEISISGVTNVPSTGTLVPSAGDVSYLCKIPHGAIITDFEEDHTCADTIALDFGLVTGTDTGDQTYSSLITAGAKATLNRRAVLNHSQGVKCSISDSDPNGYGILGCKVASGSMTATCSVRWRVTYRMDTGVLS